MSQTAAALFHELSKAYELLSDPTARAAYDGLQRAKLERRKRHEQLDSKRRKLKDGTRAPPGSGIGAGLQS